MDNFHQRPVSIQRLDLWTNRNDADPVSNSHATDSSDLSISSVSTSFHLVACGADRESGAIDEESSPPKLVNTRFESICQISTQLDFDVDPSNAPNQEKSLAPNRESGSPIDDATMFESMHNTTNR